MYHCDRLANSVLDVKVVQAPSFFCNGLRKKLDDSEFKKEFWKVLDEAYKHHFFIVDSKNELLV